MAFALAEEGVVEGAAEVRGSVWMLEESALHSMVIVERCVCGRVARRLMMRLRMVSRALLQRQRTWHASSLVLEVERRMSAQGVARARMRVSESRIRRVEKSMMQKLCRAVIHAWWWEKWQVLTWVSVNSAVVSGEPAYWVVSQR